MTSTDSSPSINALSTDVVANILGYLGDPAEIMLSRACKKMRDAATIVIVVGDFRIDSVRRYNALVAMRRALPNTQRKNALGEVTRALPNLQRITIGNLGRRIKYKDGADPDEAQAAKTRRNWTTHDLSILSTFTKLRTLEIAPYTGLNGRYPFLFNFSLLETLVIKHCSFLKWDLEILSGLPLLKTLICRHHESLRGNINSFRVLRDTLEKVDIGYCHHVEGNFMDLADFHHLRDLNLFKTAVTGDVRKINVNDFQSLKQMFLPSKVYGGFRYEFQRISEVPAFVNSIHPLVKRSPTLFGSFPWSISQSSPDWYDSHDHRYRDPPLCFKIVHVGSRIGWRWLHCEVNWLDPEPAATESEEYHLYCSELRRETSDIGMYKGYHQPPTEEEYRRLCHRFGPLHEYDDSSEEYDSDYFSIGSPGLY